MAVALGAALLGWACSSNKASSEGDTTFAAGDADKVTKDFHASVVNDAGANYTLVDERQMIEVKNTLDHGGAVHDLHVTAWKMAHTSSSVERFPFVAAFKSDKPYKKMGIGDKDNYILRYPAPGDTVYLMVPSDLKVPITVLDYDAKTVFSHSTHTPPQVVKEVAARSTEGGRPVEDIVIGGCIEGTQCPSGHCAVSASGARLTASRYQKIMAAQPR